MIFANNSVTQKSPISNLQILNDLLIFVKGRLSTGQNQHQFALVLNGIFLTFVFEKDISNMEKMKVKTTLTLCLFLLLNITLIAQSTTLTYKERGSNRYSVDIYFSGNAGEESITPDAFFDYQNICFTIKPNPQSERNYFKDKYLEDYFATIKLFQYNNEIALAQAPQTMINPSGKIDRIVLFYRKRDVELFKPFTFVSALDTAAPIMVNDSYFMYFSKYEPIYEDAMDYSDQLKYIDAYNAVMEIIKDVTAHQEIKFYSFYDNASDVLIGNAINKHADSLNHLLTITENNFKQSFSETDLAKIDSVYAMIKDAATLFEPYLQMEYPKSATLKQKFNDLVAKSELVAARNEERYKNNKLYFFQKETYNNYQFQFYIDLLARMLTNLDTLTVIGQLDTLNITKTKGLEEAFKELKITNWEEDFGTMVSLLNNDIKENGKIFNDSIMGNLQKLKKKEKQPYQQIFLAFNALDSNDMLFENFLKNALVSCTDEDLIKNLEMWLLSYNLTFEGVDEYTVKNINRGIGLIEQQRWDEASAIFSTITKQASTIAPPWFYLGRTLFEQEQSFIADTKLDLALDINPYYIAPRLFKFQILYQQENYNKLLKKVDEALHDNKIWLYHYWRAKALYALGQFKAAIAEIEGQCLKINNNEPDEYYLLGDAYAAIKDYDSAEKAYTKTQEINPHNIDDRFNEKMMKLQEARKE